MRVFKITLHFNVHHWVIGLASSKSLETHKWLIIYLLPMCAIEVQY